MDLYDELKRILNSLNSHGIDYAICGGVAVALHGYARFTKDIVILIRPEDLDRAVELARTLGYTTTPGLIPFDTGTPKERKVYRVTKAEKGDLLTVDFVLVGRAFQAVWADRGVFDWEGRRIQVVSLEGPARMKKLAGREQDLLDLKKLGVEGPSDDSSQDPS